MKKRIARLFQYTRDLEHRDGINKIIVRELQREVGRLQELESKFSKMTIEELEEILTACVDYQGCLKRLRAGDPIQHRVLPIFKKYNVKVERNTATDEVIEEAKAWAKEQTRKGLEKLGLPLPEDLKDDD